MRARLRSARGAPRRLVLPRRADERRMPTRRVATADGRAVVELFAGPLPAASLASATRAARGGGAVLTFEGVVRRLEAGSAIEALDYEAYSPLTERTLLALAASSLDEGDVRRVVVQHSVGRVPVGACSFRLLVEAMHRAPALATVARYVDSMKREVPLWKVPVFLPPAHEVG